MVHVVGEAFRIPLWLGTMSRWQIILQQLLWNATSSQIVGLKLIAIWRAGNSTGAATRQFFRLCILAMGVVPSWFIRLFLMRCGTIQYPVNWLHWANLIPALTGSSITSLFLGCGYSGLTWSQLWPLASMTFTWNCWFTVVWYPLPCVNLITALRVIRHLFTACFLDVFLFVIWVTKMWSRVLCQVVFKLSDSIR